MNFKASFRFKTPLNNKKTQRTVVNKLSIGNLVDVYCLQLILPAIKNHCTELCNTFREYCWLGWGIHSSYLCFL